MGIESTLADLKGKQLSELPKVTAAGTSNSSNSAANRNRSRNKQSRKNRRRQKKIMVSPVQRLYETCKDVFANCSAGIVPSPEKIERLKAVLGMFSFTHYVCFCGTGAKFDIVIALLRFFYKIKLLVV